MAGLNLWQNSLTATKLPHGSDGNHSQQEAGDT